MSADRRKFTREPPEARREALVAAALELLAEGGVAAATSRAIAGRAGVTAGLIRHHFATKADLTHAAFGALMARMTEENRAVLAGAPQEPVARLARFVAAALTAPVVDAGRFGLWATFNGVIDGLWLEGCALPAVFATGDLARIGLGAVGAMVGQDLGAAMGQAGET